MKAESSAEEEAPQSTDEATVENGRITFRRALLRPFGTVWDTRPVSESPCAGVRFRCAVVPRPPSAHELTSVPSCVAAAAIGTTRAMRTTRTFCR